MWMLELIDSSPGCIRNMTLKDTQPGKLSFSLDKYPWERNKGSHGDSLHRRFPGPITLKNRGVATDKNATSCSPSPIYKLFEVSGCLPSMDSRQIKNPVMIPIAWKCKVSHFFFFSVLEIFTDFISVPRIITMYSQSQLKPKDNTFCFARHHSISKKTSNEFSFQRLPTTKFFKLVNKQHDPFCLFQRGVSVPLLAFTCQASFAKFRILMGFKSCIGRSFIFEFSLVKK